jgi:hypothetical protein
MLKGYVGGMTAAPARLLIPAVLNIKAFHGRQLTLRHPLQFSAFFDCVLSTAIDDFSSVGLS